MKRGVLNSDAIGVLPDYAVAGELSTNSLVALDLEEPPPPISLRVTTLTPPQDGSPLDGLIARLAPIIHPPAPAPAARRPMRVVRDAAGRVSHLEPI